jgi:tRNA threonylcarbamoyladenosine modification (KEOPS) complex  Pcc1 subunit
MDKMHLVELFITLPKSERQIFIDSLTPEIKTTMPRTHVNISETNAGVKFIIEAENTSALRATLNSYLRWLNCISSIASSIE